LKEYQLSHHFIQVLLVYKEHNAPDDTSTGSVDTQGSAFSGFSDEEYKFTGAATGYTDA
jgi:hypothetical protein